MIRFVYFSYFHGVWILLSMAYPWENDMGQPHYSPNDAEVEILTQSITKAPKNP